MGLERGGDGAIAAGLSDCIRVCERGARWSGGGSAWRHFGGRKAFIGVGCVYGCNTSESIIMTRHPPTTEIRILLRTILSAGVLAVLLACAGTAAGATWIVDDDGGASVDYASMQVEVAV